MQVVINPQHNESKHTERARAILAREQEVEAHPIEHKDFDLIVGKPLDITLITALLSLSAVSESRPIVIIGEASISVQGQSNDSIECYSLVKERCSVKFYRLGNR